MKRYKDYMDTVEVSDTLHEKLKHLEEPEKKPRPWAKWGAMAAALALVAGVGTWGLSRGGWGALMDNFHPTGDWNDLIDHFDPAIGTVLPEIADIASEDPDHVTDPGMKTGGGYEVVHGDKNDPDTMVSYYFLPWLEWADASGSSMMDYSLAPPSAVSRDASWDDVLLFTGGERAMADHLLWNGLDWGGTVWFEDDSTPCAAGLSASGEGLEFFLEVMKGYEVPSCIVLPEEYYETSQWQGVEITAVKGGGYAVIDGVELNEKREVSFFCNGVGYKLTLYAADVGRADELCARFVRYAVDGGFHLYALSDEPIYEEDLPNEDGVQTNRGLPPEDAPTANILHPGDPGYVEPFPAPDGVPDGDSESISCPYCADGTVHTHPYDPGASN